MSNCVRAGATTAYEQDEAHRPGDDQCVEQRARPWHGQWCAYSFRRYPRSASIAAIVATQYGPHWALLVTWNQTRHTVTALLAAALFGCSGSGDTAASAAQPPMRPAAGPAEACRLPSGQESGPLSGSIVVLGVISIPREYGQAVAVRTGPWRYWQKWPLAVRAGSAPVVIMVPKAWQHRAAITWGLNTGIVGAVRLPGCALVKGMWNAYAGGVYLRPSTACVSLVFRAGGRSATVRFGVGRRCRGRLS